MSSFLADYSALSPSSTRTDVTQALRNIINGRVLFLGFVLFTISLVFLAPLPFITRSDREELLKLLIYDLKNCGSKSRLTNKDAAQAMLALKTLGKDPQGSLYLSSPGNLSTLLAFSSTFKDDPEASGEALRAVANALLLIVEARVTFVSKDVGGSTVTLTMFEKATTPDQIFILSRILFLCTAEGTPLVRTLVEERHHGRTIIDIIALKLDMLITAILSGTKLAREAMTDLLKFTFNLLHHYPKLTEPEAQTTEAKDEKEAKIMGDFWSSRLDSILPPLLRTFASLPPTFPCPMAAPLTHVIHALITIPISSNLRPYWFGNSSPNHSNSNSTSKSPSSPISFSRSDSPSRGNSSPVMSPRPSTLDRALSVLAPHRRSSSRAESPAVNIDVLQRAMDLLDVSFSHFFPENVDVDDPSVKERARRDSPDNSSDALDDLLSPLLVLISRLCIADEQSRIRVRQWIVPDDLDRTSPLEARSDILGRCLRLLGSVYHSRLKDSVGEMLFAVADSNAPTLCALFGYGNVAGYLFNKGIMNAPPPNTSTTNASLTTPGGAQINPITGTTEKPKPNVPEMTEEEKEREMEKLFVLFDRLEKSGNLPPDQNPIRKAMQESKLNM